MVGYKDGFCARLFLVDQFYLLGCWLLEISQNVDRIRGTYSS